MVDQYLLRDVYTPNLIYFQSGRSLLASPSSVSDHRSIESRAFYSFSITPLKLEEDVVVFMLFFVSNAPVDRGGSSLLQLIFF